MSSPEYDLGGARPSEQSSLQSGSSDLAPYRPTDGEQPGYQEPYAQAGYQQPYAQPAYGMKSKVAAGVLGILLGTLGIHNFYLGHTGKGIAQLLISLLSLGMLAWVVTIWGLVEGILILTAEPGSHPWGVDAYGTPLRA
ncbi:MAG: TM2 domain-containing protein [Actinomyces sp.]|uniref:TM2 domain-containing protein n=1 Tax=Actinomyces sp. TaxID=29317 RepID=UPI0026DD979E|nr:TM2 domain-containing protein [Actinomyces sp.]MDO4243965.1 TM2 domain-containing protein [Actinomyces sp.]